MCLIGVRERCQQIYDLAIEGICVLLFACIVDLCTRMCFIIIRQNTSFSVTFGGFAGMYRSAAARRSIGRTYTALDESGVAVTTVQ